MATKKTTAKKAAPAKGARAAKATGAAAAKSMPKAGRNPKGGLTQAGREYFAKRDGSHLKPGVTGAADTPEKMLRKGSFLVRTFTHPRGPMVDPKGQPTRLALSAHAWGEKVPKSVSEAHRLAAKGHQLLARYHAQQEKAGGTHGAAKKVPAGKKVGRPAARKTAAKAAGTTQAAARKAAAKATTR